MSAARNSRFDRAKSVYHKKYKLLAPYVPELIAMKNDLRTAIQMTLPMEDKFRDKLSLLEEFCRKVGFFLDHYEINQENKILIANKNLSDVDWEDKALEYQMGELCAYPGCCIENFATHKEWTHPLINNIRDLVAQAESFPFSMNPFLRTSPFHLYKHFPCSLQCGQSINYCSDLLEVIGDENRELYDDIVRFNLGPAFYTDICGIGIMFRGEIADGVISYNEYYCDYEPSSIFQLSCINQPGDLELFNELISAISRGSQIELDEAKLTVRIDSERLTSIDRPDRLRWTIVDFR
jgi:hypothetical protein